MSRSTRPAPAAGRRLVRTRQLAAVSLAGLLSVAAVGCDERGSDSGTDTSAPAPAGSADGADGASTATDEILDPCTLVPLATLESLAGGPVEQQGEAFDQARGRACRWSLPSGGGIGGAELVVTAWHGQEFYLAGTIGEDVSGIADEAQADPSLGMVLLRKGDEVISAQALATPDDGLELEVARAIAEAL